jgi:hypothetical protein
MEKMMTFDVTTNRIPFGLLTPEEQATLKAWPHGWEILMLDHLRGEIVTPYWINRAIYRGKPPLVFVSKWVNLYSNNVGSTLFDSRKKADEAAAPFRIAVLRFDTCSCVSTAHIEEV